MDSVLVADDEHDVRRLVTKVLTRYGYNVFQASDGEEAEEKILREIPDLVLLDIVMPKKGGFDVCRSIKNNINTHFVPVSMFSVLGRPVDIKMSQEAGADGHITKPFTPEELVSEIEIKISESKKSRFSRAVGLELGQISKKVFLYEYHSSTHYEKVIRDYIIEAKQNMENLVVLTRESSIVHELFKDKQDITLIPFQLPIDLSQIIQEPEKQCFVFDNITDLIQSTGFQTAYDFTEALVDKLSSEGVSSLFLLNSDKHDNQELQRIQSLFNNQLRAPPPSYEQPTLNKFENSDVQAIFFVNTDTFMINEDFDLGVELINPGNDSASLIKMERIVPSNLLVTRVSKQYTVKENVLDFRGRRLKPLSSIEVVIGVKATEKGDYTIKPNIVFIDNNGIYKEFEPEPLSIRVNDMQSVIEKMLNLRQSIQQEKKDQPNAPNDSEILL